MNHTLYKMILLALLLMFICAPFAGLTPLLLVMVIAGIYWFISSMVQISKDRQDSRCFPQSNSKLNSLSLD